MATGTTVLPNTPTPGAPRRLRTKTACPPQQSLLAPLQLGLDAATDQQRQVYLVTLPFPRQPHACLSGPSRANRVYALVVRGGAFQVCFVL